MKTKLTQTIIGVSLAATLGCTKGGLLMSGSDCPAGQVRSGSGNLCISETAKLGATACKDPDLASLKAGVEVTMCDGTTGVGTLTVPGACTEDGQLACVTAEEFPAVKKSNLSADKIAKGTTIAGVVGTKRAIQQCRNGAALSTYDASDATNISATGLAVSSCATANPTTITVGSAHGLATNSPVYFTGTMTGLVASTTYYAIPVTATTFQVAQTVNGAAFGDASGGCVETATLFNAADSIASPWDTVDDFNNGAANPSPSTSAFGGSNYLCNESNFVSAINTTNLVPTNATVTYGTPALTWTQIWQDQLTGLYFTNPLKNATAGSTWADVYRMCSLLNSGDGAGNWRLPTQKELMQLHIDGVAKVGLPTALTNSDSFWSASAMSNNTISAWIVNLANGSTGSGMRVTNSLWALCVR